MPIYQYGCKSCKHTFTEHYKIDDRNIPITQPCPNCKVENQVEMHLGVPGIAFDSLVKPPGDFRERMQEMKKKFKYDPYAKIKDY